MLPFGGNVELALSFVDAEGGSVEADDVTNAVGDWEILEAIGVYDDGGVVVVAGLVTLLVEGGVDDFEGANILLLLLLRLVGFVGESSIDNNTVDVVKVGGCEGHLGKFSVLVLLSGLGNLSGSC